MYHRNHTVESNDVYDGRATLIFELEEGGADVVETIAATVRQHANLDIRVVSKLSRDVGRIKGMKARTGCCQR
jgi:hypothetical protein